MDTGAVDFRLLGPLEAVAAGEALPLGGPKQRALLALLLIHANEVVSIDTLIEELWGDSPPRTAPAYIQNCVSRLRRVLGAHTLETRPPGYVLRIEPETIDARRFERLALEVRDAPARERAAGLRDALQLWHGPPLADLAFESFAQTEARRLDELRLAALEERIEAELELGMHAELVGELEALAREHPARERLRRLQMLALYRAGRQVDALAAYQEARLALDELGLEPSEELRALERMILVHDPTLGAAVPAPPKGPAPAAPAREARRPVAVVLAELSLDPALDPEAARREASRCLAEIQAVVERHGGVVEQLLGEEVVALFGIPAAHEDDALRALHAALEVRDAVAPVELRAAVAVGELVVGEATALAGGAITAARRVKESAGAGEIVLGPKLGRLAGAAVETDGPRLLGLAKDARLLPLRLDTPFVGRQAELEQLELAAREAFSTRSCRHLVVVGDPGVGKSRLAVELAASLAREARVLTARCVPYGEGATYLPLRDILDDAFGGGELRPALLEALAGEEQPEKIAELLSGAVTADASPTTSGDTQWAARRVLEALARERPLLVVLEDLHWAEPTFLDLVEYVAGWSEDVPLVLLSLARPELLDARPAWGSAAVALRPLPRDEAAALVRDLPEGKLVGEDALGSVLDAADGNPLFLEQLAAAAAEQELESGRVPASLDALLASRLDRLPHDERAVLERAAVVGREFTRAAVEALWETEETGAVSRCLMAFARRRLVQPDRAGAGAEDAFRFDHVLIRDAAYAAVTKGERARLHERLARWLDERGELDEVVGYHLEQAALYCAEIGQADAGLAEEAGRLLGEAGTRELWISDSSAAFGLLVRAVALLPDDERRLELELDLGVAMKFAGDLRGGESQLESVLQKASRLGDRRIEFRARIELWWPRWSRGAVTLTDTLKLVDEAIPVFESASDVLSLAHAWRLTAVVYANLGRFSDCEAAALQALEYYSAAGLPRQQMASMLASAACRGPTPVADAIRRCDTALAETRTPASRSFVLPLLAELEAMLSHFDLARTLLVEARAGRLESVHSASVNSNWAWVAAKVELMADDAEAAEAILADACEALRATDDAAWLATNLAALAEAVLRQGRFDECLVLTDEALALAPPDDQTTQTLAQSARAKAFARTGKLPQAERLARGAVAIREASDLLNDRAESLLALAEVLQLRGKTAEAAEALEQAHALFEAKGNVVAADRTRASLLALAG